MIRHTDIFHTGIAVLDIEEAQRELSRALGVERWVPAWAPDWTVRTPVGDVRMGCRISISVDPPHLELLQGERGTVWDTEAGSQRRIHHYGVWVDDLAAEMEHLEKLGMPVEVAGVGPGGEYPWLWSYHVNRLGVRIELCSTALRVNFEKMIARARR